MVNLKPTIHEATFVTGDTATLLSVRAAHEISNAALCKLLEDRQPVYFQATCSMYHAIFPCAACMNNNVAVSPVTKVASCMVGSTSMSQYILNLASMYTNFDFFENCFLKLVCTTNSDSRYMV